MAKHHGGDWLSHTHFLCFLLNTQPKDTNTHDGRHTHSPLMRIRGNGWSTAYCRHELRRPGYIFSKENKISEAPLQQENTPDTQTLLLCALNANESGDLGTSDKSPSVLVYAARRLVKLGWCMFHMTRIQTALAGEILTRSNNLHNRQLSFQVNGWKWWIEMQYQFELFSERYHRFAHIKCLKRCKYRGKTWFIYYKLDPETSKDCLSASKVWWWWFIYYTYYLLCKTDTFTFFFHF